MTLASSLIPVLSIKQHIIHIVTKKISLKKFLG